MTAVLRTRHSLAVIRAQASRNEMQEKFPWAVECKKGSFSNLEQRKLRTQWLVRNYGPRGSRWDYFIRSTGGSTMCFANRDDAMIFKLTWGGDV